MGDLLPGHLRNINGDNREIQVLRQKKERHIIVRQIEYTQPQCSSQWLCYKCNIVPSLISTSVTCISIFIPSWSTMPQTTPLDPLSTTFYFSSLQTFQTHMHKHWVSLRTEDKTTPLDPLSTTFCFSSLQQYKNNYKYKLILHTILIIYIIIIIYIFCTCWSHSVHALLKRGVNYPL